MDREVYQEVIHRLAREAGFDRCGIARAKPVHRADYVREWLAAGRHGSMEYLARHLDVRLDPCRLLPNARTVVIVALIYHQPLEASPAGDGASTEGVRGRIARYAWGDDYHDVVRGKLRGMVGAMRCSIVEPFDSRICVDTAPLLEREFAAAAGIGWIGKNTLILNESLGSYFVLGALVTTLEIAEDAPAKDHCGTCTRCLDACPTRAFPEPYQMDASRCISYWTIEHRGEIPRDQHGAIGEWLFGCDICQEVCPFNADPPRTSEPRFAIRHPAPAPAVHGLLDGNAEELRKALDGSAMLRATHEMWVRNARIVAENAPAPGR